MLPPAASNLIDIPQSDEIFLGVGIISCRIPLTKRSFSAISTWWVEGNVKMKYLIITD